MPTKADQVLERLELLEVEVTAPVSVVVAVVLRVPVLVVVEVAFENVRVVVEDLSFPAALVPPAWKTLACPSINFCSRLTRQTSLLCNWPLKGQRVVT